MFTKKLLKHQVQRKLFHQQIRTFSKIRVLKSTSNDPFVNLATEDWLFNDCDTTEQTLYLWQNDKTVVIGKHQNPWKECFIQKMEQDNVNLARRRSGGGAVYQDLGNSIFTFLSPKLEYDKEANFSIICDALNTFGVNAQVSGRNDMTVDGKKISGSAFKVGSKSAIHHGTLLVDVDMNALQNYLNPNKLKLASKGITSVVSRVVNLKELNPGISHQAICDALIKSFYKHYKSECQIEEINLKTLENISSWKKYYDELRDWHWRFGKTPQFSHNFETRFDWGLLDVYIESDKNMITNCKIYSDTLYPIIVEQMEKHLIGHRYSPEGVAEAAKLSKDEITNLMLSDVPTIHKYVDDMSAWIAKSL